MRKSQVIVVGLSGRGDKDVHTVEAALASGSGAGHARPPLAASGGRR
jgi:hypothetical protein